MHTMQSFGTNLQTDIRVKPVWRAAPKAACRQVKARGACGDEALATLNRPTLKTVDTVTKQETVSFKERTDVTAVPAMGIVAETMVALVLAQEAQRNFGGDSVEDFVRKCREFCKENKLNLIVLVGLMGSGKTTVGRELAKKLNLSFADSDELIEKRASSRCARFLKKRRARVSSARN